MPTLDILVLEDNLSEENAKEGDVMQYGDPTKERPKYMVIS